MQPGTEAEISRILAGAELWTRLDRAAPGDDAAARPDDAVPPELLPEGPLVMLAGWSTISSP
jgi:hypothetical protein